MHPKDAAGIANSVDPDQTAPSLIWVCTVCPYLSVRKFRIIMVALFEVISDSVGVKPQGSQPSSLAWQQL